MERGDGWDKAPGEAAEKNAGGARKSEKSVPHPDELLLGGSVDPEEFADWLRPRDGKESADEQLYLPFEKAAAFDTEVWARLPERKQGEKT